MSRTSLRSRSASRGGVDVAGRVDALQRVLDSGGDRLNPVARERAEAVLARTGERLALGLDHTVVAFAGATGSGKSSLFNALCGADVATVGARRPTTSKASGLVIGAGGDALLDWLGVPRRHRIDSTRRSGSSLEVTTVTELEGLILLDLPDHDSTAVAHRLEVDRLVRLVDLLVWVVDPQKYADDALHSGYLQPMASHASVMTVVLNQIDRLPPDSVAACISDLQRLLAEDGLGPVPVLAVSARTGEGLTGLRRQIVRAVDAHEAVKDRVVADLDETAAQLGDSVARTELSPDSVPGAQALLDVLSAAAGVPTVLDAVALDYQRQARAHTGWPFTRWVGRLRRNPLRRLSLGASAGSRKAIERPPGALDVTRFDRSSLPVASQGQQAQVALATRQIATECAAGLPIPWQDAVREAALPPGADLADALDRAVTRVDLRFRRPLWWSVFGALQVLLAIAVVAGGLWLGGLALLDYFRFATPEPPMVWLVQPQKLGIPLPTALLIGGLVLGLLVAFIASALARVGAARRRRTVGKALRASVEQVGRGLVLEPVSAVLADHRATRTALAELR